MHHTFASKRFSSLITVIVFCSVVMLVRPVQAMYMDATFIRAAIEGNVHVLNMMMNRGVHPDREQLNRGDDDPHDGLHTYNGLKIAEGSTALMWAAKNGHIDAITLLLKRGAGVNYMDKRGDTALMWAAESGRMEVVKFLIDNRARASLLNDKGDNAIDFARKKNRFEMANYLKDFSNAGQSYQHRPKSRKIEDHSYDESLKIHHDEKVDNHGEHLLDAVFRGDLEETLDLNMDEGHPVNYQNHDGLSPLMVAARDGRVALIELLITSGADPELKDEQGRTALLWAAIEGRLESLKMLTKYGGNLLAWDRLETNALMWASYWGRNHIVRYLIDNHMNVNRRDLNGETPLMWASRAGRFSTAKLLLERGADPDSKNIRDMKSIDFAFFYWDLIELLKQAKSQSLSLIAK